MAKAAAKNVPNKLTATVRTRTGKGHNTQRSSRR